MPNSKPKVHPLQEMEGLSSRSIELEYSETPCTTPVRRCIESKDGLIKRIPGHETITTLSSLFSYAIATHGSRPYLGRQTHFPDGTLGEYEWETYARVGERSRNFGAGLLALGLTKRRHGMKMLGIMSRNRAEWVIGEQGLLLIGGTTVPIYENYPPRDIEYVLKQTGLMTVLCSREELRKVLGCRRWCRSLKAIILMDEPTKAEQKLVSDMALALYTFTEVEHAGAPEHNTNQSCLVCPSVAQPSGIATLSYTSGTSGLPKGVMLTHACLIATLGSAVSRGVVMNEYDVHLSFLPLAHVFERQSQYLFMLGGGRIGFNRGDPDKIMEDIEALRPTVLVSVPKLLNNVFENVMALAPSSSVFGAALRYGVKSKLRTVTAGRGYRHRFWNSLIFDRMAKTLGLDRCRLIITASAPIRGEVKDFFRAVCSCVVVEGFGQTETGAAGTVTLADDYSSNHVGVPSASLEIMLQAVPEMGYLPSDTEHCDGDSKLACCGRGEICLRGPSVFSGYYKMPEETASILDKNGWCHTGDIGIWLPSGQLQIVDRKNNMFKLSQGEYVMPEKVEEAYCRSPMVAQAFVYGDPIQNCTVGVIVPNFTALSPLLPGFRLLPGTSRAEVCASEAVNEAVLGSIRHLGKAASLRGFEQVRAISLREEPFTVQNGLLTPTYKLRRKECKAAMRTELDTMYADIKCKPDLDDDMMLRHSFSCPTLFGSAKSL